MAEKEQQLYSLIIRYCNQKISLFLANFGYNQKNMWYLCTELKLISGICFFLIGDVGMLLFFHPKNIKEVSNLSLGVMELNDTAFDFVRC